MKDQNNIVDGISRKSSRQEESPQATTVLVFGILGIVCTILFPIAWFMGNQELKKGFPNIGSLKAGRLIGMISTVVIVTILLAQAGFVGYALFRGADFR